MSENNLNSHAAKALSKLGAAKGGNARAASLSAEQRSQIAKAAVEARWRNAGKLSEVPQATHGSHDRPLRIGELEIPCYVLHDGRRVLAQAGMVRALGMTPGGSSHGRDRMLKFATQERLKPFTSNKLKVGTLVPIEFQTPDGKRMLGYEAALLADLCDAVLEARKEGALADRQQHIATHCEILVRGFARVGIIALVDEATGYQADRSKDALAKILEAFVQKELRKWIRTFPADFYKELFRLRNIPYGESVKRPQYIGHLTNDLVYARLAPEVLSELRRITPRNDKGRLKHHLFRRLTDDVGHPKLLQHLSAVIALMTAADNWDQFKRMIDRALPRYTAMPLFEKMEEESERLALSDEGRTTQ